MNRLLLILLVASSLFLASQLQAAYVSLRWTAPGDDGNVGTARQYDIRFSKTPITDANWTSAIQATGEPSPTAAGTSQTFVIGGLQSGVTYYFAIKTADAAGNWSALSNVLQRVTCAACTGTTGNVDGSVDGKITLADLSSLISYLSGNPNHLTICPELSNCDGSSNGRVDLSDLLTLIQFFNAQAKLAPCPGL